MTEQILAILEGKGGMDDEEAADRLSFNILGATGTGENDPVYVGLNEAVKESAAGWFLLELREKTSTAPSAGSTKAFAGEKFFPRDIGPYVFVRAANFADTLAPPEDRGVVGIVCEKGTNGPNQGIQVVDSYVQNGAASVIPRPTAESRRSFTWC
jgi:hypothetical protein